MGKLIINPIYDSPILNLEAKDIDNLFKLYGYTEGQLSEENLGKIASNIAISFGDFVIRVGTNIKANVSGMFKDFKRSTLLIAIQSNKLGVNRLYGADYSKLVNMIIPLYPFTKPPKDVINYINSMITTFDMERRIVSIIDKYMMIGSAIGLKDLDKAQILIQDVNDLLINKRYEVSDELIRIVAPSGKNRSTFGDVFDSVSEFREAIDLGLLNAQEFEKAINVGKLLEKLYSAFNTIHNNIIKVKDTSMSIQHISGIATTMNDTGVLIEQYAMLMKEYHHYEYFLSLVIEEGLKEMKK